MNEVNKAAAVMLRGRGVPVEVIARVLNVPILRVEKWIEWRLVV